MDRKGILEYVGLGGINKTDLRNWGLVLLLFIALTAVLLLPIFAHLAKSTFNGEGDLYQNLWSLWWVKYSMFHLHTSPYSTNLLFYPIGANLVTETLSPMAAMLSIPFQAVNLVLAYNAIAILGFVLSGFFMYLLAYYITGNKYAGIAAGIIFAFSPMHISQSLGAHLNWDSIEFVPLFILMFIVMLDRKKPIFGAYAGIAFSLVVFFGDPEQGLMVMLLALFILVYYALTKRSHILSRKFAYGMLIMIFLFMAFSWTFLSPILGNIRHGALKQANQLNDITHNTYWSDPILSFFLPSPYNTALGGLSHSYFQIYSGFETERIAYIGYCALALLIAAVAYDIKTHKLRNTALWLFSFIVFALLSLGPIVEMGAVSSTRYHIPGLYYLVRATPLLSLVREPGRFDMIATLALAVLVGFGIKTLFDGHLAVHKKSTKRIVFAAICGLILLEYSGIAPISSSLLISPHIPKAYSEIGKISGNYTVMVLPTIKNTTVAPEEYPGLDMYYQTAFQRPMMAGYTSRENATQQLVALENPLAVGAFYLENGYGFATPSPIVENMTNLTIFWLSTYSTRFIGITNGAYNKTEYVQLTNYLGGLLGKPVYVSQNATVYSVNSTLYQKAQGTMTSFANTEQWIPGYIYCDAGVAAQCNNSTFKALWWGTSSRALYVYAPNNNTYVNVSIIAQSYEPSGTVNIYLNSARNPAISFNTTDSLREYSMQFNLPRGVNQLLLVTQNSTQMSNLGVRNITIQKAR